MNDVPFAGIASGGGGGVDLGRRDWIISNLAAPGTCRRGEKTVQRSLPAGSW
jgi:hypothetical protein